MSVRHAGIPATEGYPRSDEATEVRRGQRRALERAYPLAKQLTEILELEADPLLVETARRLRRAIGATLALLGEAESAGPSSAGSSSESPSS